MTTHLPPELRHAAPAFPPGRRVLGLRHGGLEWHAKPQGTVLGLWTRRPLGEHGPNNRREVVVRVRWESGMEEYVPPVDLLRVAARPVCEADLVAA